MILIGVYGRIASGKSVLLDVMEEQGYRCLDCDRISDWLFKHTDSENGAEMKRAIAKRFGRVYEGDRIVPDKLGVQVREDLGARAELAAITEEFTCREIRRRLGEFKAEGAERVAIDAVQTLSADKKWDIDCTVQVTAPVFNRILWLRMRDGLPLREAERRVHLLDAGDPADKEKIRYVLENDGSLSEFRRKCGIFLRERETLGW